MKDLLTQKNTEGVNFQPPQKKWSTPPPFPVTYTASTPPGIQCTTQGHIITVGIY